VLQDETHERLLEGKSDLTRWAVTVVTTRVGRGPVTMFRNPNNFRPFVVIHVKTGNLQPALTKGTKTSNSKLLFTQACVL
jgi:hypothetical protein